MRSTGGGLWGGRLRSLTPPSEGPSAAQSGQREIRDELWRTFGLWEISASPTRSQVALGGLWKMSESRGEVFWFPAFYAGLTRFERGLRRCSMEACAVLAMGVREPLKIRGDATRSSEILFESNSHRACDRVGIDIYLHICG